MPLDKVTPLKQESGADDAEYLNSPLDANEDAVNVRGVYIQKDTGNDVAVVITRDSSDNLTFTDPGNGTCSLGQLKTHDASAAGQILISVDGVNMEPRLPLSSEDGHLINSNTGYMLVAG